MTGIKEVPVKIKTYYSNLLNSTKEAKTSLLEEKEKLEEKLIESYNEIKSQVEDINKAFKVDLNDYEEFKTNTYIDGKFLRVAKGIFLNKTNDYEATTERFAIYSLAKKQQELYNINKKLDVYNKILNLKFKDYTEILRIYTNKIHEKLILEGYGYSFGNEIGWTCINRCVIDKARRRPRVDWKKTKLREQELLAAGKKIYNKEEADWCEKNGIEYKAEDKRVFQKIEAVYEIPLLGNKIKGGKHLKLEIADYRATELRGKTNEEIQEECNNDTTKICNIRADLRTKLNMCVNADKLLYTKFIRNENQKPIADTAFNRKNR